MKANKRLENALNAVRAKYPMDPVMQTNIVAASQSAASRAYATGERYSYPRKHYARIEEIFGAMSAQELGLFRESYDAYMAWENESRT